MTDWLSPTPHPAFLYVGKRGFVQLIPGSKEQVETWAGLVKSNTAYAGHRVSVVLGPVKPSARKRYFIVNATDFFQTT